MVCRRIPALLRLAVVALSTALLGCAATNPRTDAVARQNSTTNGASRGNVSSPPRLTTTPPAKTKGRPAVVPASYDSKPVDGSESTDKTALAERAEIAEPDSESNESSNATDHVNAGSSVITVDPAAAVVATDAQQPHLLDLPLVLELVNGQNPQVLYARERINEALAQLQRAEVLWLPSIRTGITYDKHEGPAQQVDGNMITASRTALFTGFGGVMPGAATPAIPGLYANFLLADAIFQPRIAQRTAEARRSAANAASNDALLDAALAYLELLRAYQERAIALEIREHTSQLAKLTAVYASTGQGVEADDDRARAELAVRENDLKRAHAAIQVKSTRLARQLSLDPMLRFEPQEPIVVPIELQATQKPLPELVAFGLTHRPEVSECRSLAGEAIEKLQREKYAPLLPSVLLGIGYGGFGGAEGASVRDFSSSFDSVVGALWEVRNLGFGERAARNEACSRMQQAQFRQVAILDRVASEVVEAHTEVEANREQLATAEEGIRAAQSSYERNLERIRNVQGLPLEALQSIQALALARREYLRVVVSFNEAQFRLQRALGWPVELIAAGQS